MRVPVALLVALSFCLQGVTALAQTPKKNKLPALRPTAQSTGGVKSNVLSGKLPGRPAPAVPPRPMFPLQARDAGAQLVLDTRGFTSPVHGLSFSPDGRFLAACGEKVVRIWDLASGRLHKTLRGERERSPLGNCYAVAYSPDGRQLVVGVDDYSAAGSIRVYDTANLDEIKQLLPGHKVPVRKLAFSRDGKYLASAGENGQVVLWDWPKRRRVGVIQPQREDQPLYDVMQFPSDEPVLLLWQASGPTWHSMPSGRKLSVQRLPDKILRWLHRFGTRRFPHQGTPQRMALRLEKDIWLASGAGKAKGHPVYWAGVWRNDGQNPQATYNGNRWLITTAALTRRGDLAATADMFGQVHVFETRTGKRRQLFHGLGASIYEVGFSPDGERLGFGTGNYTGKDWRRNHYAPVNHVFHLKQGAIDASGNMPRILETTQSSGHNLYLASANGHLALDVFRGNQRLHRFNVRTGASPWCYTFLRNSPRLGLQFPIVFGDDSGEVRCVDPVRGKRRRLFLGHSSSVTSLSESPNGKLLATSSIDRTIRIWSLQKYEPTGEVDFEYVSDTVTKVPSGGSAARAGVRKGDKMISIDGKSMADLEKMLLDGTYPYKPGHTVAVVMSRGGRQYVVDLTLVEGPDLQQPLVSMFVTADGDWVMWTPQGYYDASPGGARLVGFHVNRGGDKSAKFYTADQFKKKLYRPDIIERILKTGEFPEQEPKPKISRLEPPLARLLEPSDGDRFQSETITVRAVVASQNNLPVQEIRILRNGRPVGDAVKGNAINQRGEVVQEIKLLSGRNELSVMAVNRAASNVSSPVTVTFTPRRQRPLINPDLYVLAVGVSKYKHRGLNLNFSHRDAEKFAEMAAKQQNGKLYRNVETKLLLNEQAMKSDILDGMDWLVRNATSNDVVVMFFSAHGFRDERQDFYLGNHGVDKEKLRATGIHVSEIDRVLEDCAARQVLLFIDSCHSGGITGAKGEFDPLKDLLATEQGRVVFCSSTPREVSLELQQHKHSAFTKALLDTVYSSQSDLNRPPDGCVGTDELRYHITQKVKQLTNKKQHPVMDQPGHQRSDFPVFQIVSR